MNRATNLLFEILVRLGPRERGQSNPITQCVCLVGISTSPQGLYLRVTAKVIRGRIPRRSCQVDTHCFTRHSHRRHVDTNACIYNEIEGQEGRGENGLTTVRRYLSKNVMCSRLLARGGRSAYFSGRESDRGSFRGLFSGWLPGPKGDTRQNKGCPSKSPLSRGRLWPKHSCSYGRTRGAQYVISGSLPLSLGNEKCVPLLRAELSKLNDQQFIPFRWPEIVGANPQEAGTI